jgi:hypothetical protein
MNEVSFLAGEADARLRDRLEEELSAFNAAVTGHRLDGSADVTGKTRGPRRH